MQRSEIGQQATHGHGHYPLDNERMRAVLPDVAIVDAGANKCRPKGDVVEGNTLRISTPSIPRSSGPLR